MDGQESDRRVSWSPPWLLSRARGRQSCWRCVRNGPERAQTAKISLMEAANNTVLTEGSSFLPHSSAVVTRTVVAPLDVIKIRFQLQSTSPDATKRTYRTMWQATKRLFREEGIRVFWRCGSRPFLPTLLLSSSISVLNLLISLHLVEIGLLCCCTGPTWASSSPSTSPQGDC